MTRTVSLNSYSVEICPEVGASRISKTDESYYVEMPGNDCKYAIKMTNSHSTRCDAKVTVDDEHVGTFRISPYGTFRLERPTHSDRQFTFFIGGSKESRMAGYSAGAPSNGLVRVTFMPEKPRPRRTFRKFGLENVETHNLYDEESFTYSSNCRGIPNSLSATQRGFSTDSSFREGHSGLSGHSAQKFVDVGQLDYDYANETTIMLRLVGSSSPDIVPIGTRSKSTAYPEPVSSHRGVTPLFV